MASKLPSTMNKVNMTQYIIDLTVDVQKSLEELRKEMHSVHDSKSYARAVCRYEYVKGLVNGIVHVINHMDEDSAFYVLDDMHNHWCETLTDCRGVLEMMKKSYWEGGNEDGTGEEPGNDTEVGAD